MHRIEGENPDNYRSCLNFTIFILFIRMMEADTVLAAEEEDTRLAISSSSERRGVRGARFNEDSPLLERDTTADAPPSEVDTATHQEPWLGSKESQNKPWWKRSSVRLASPYCYFETKLLFPLSY